MGIPEIGALALLALLLWSLAGFHDAVTASLQGTRLTLYQKTQLGVFVSIGLGALIALPVLLMTLPS